MNASFGIDHPLLATRDIEALRNRLIALGFTMTPVGKHPWGTSTSLAMFQGCLIEIMGVYDESLIDALPAGDFHFGRHIHSHLAEREGVSLTALHSKDALTDSTRAEAAGFTLAGHLEFGRDVTLPDGRKDRTKTTLALLPDADSPRMSFFLCQQHRPDLIYVPDWLQHANSVQGICGVTVLATPRQQAVLHPRLTRLYGPAQDHVGGYAVQTANGPIILQTRAAIEANLAPLPQAVTDETPAIVAMDLHYANREAFQTSLTSSALPYRQIGEVTLLDAPEHTANTLLSFRDSKAILTKR
jgi:hypothetical protein